MKILIDNNIAMDALLSRPPFSVEAESLLELLAVNECNGIIASKSVTDIYYSLKKQLGAQFAKSALGSFLCLVDVASTTSENINAAFKSSIKDFEDAVIEAVAADNKVDYIITNNKKDFAESFIATKSAGELVIEAKNRRGVSATHIFKT